jgi:hypothetical protein
MTMTLRSAIAISVALALAGCATHPLPGDFSRISTYQIVQQIRCDAKRAVIDYGRTYGTASIAYEFEFDVTENNVLGADATFGWPLASGGQFGLQAGGSVDRTRANVRNIRVLDTFDQLRALDCAMPPRGVDALYPVAGDIGTYEVVSTFIALQAADNPQVGDVFTFSDKLRFTTILSGGLRPQLTLVPVADQFRLAALSGTLSGLRRDIHAVTLTLAGSVKQRGKPGKVMPAAAVAGGIPPGSSLVGTTVLQTVTDPRERALIELDRQRVLTLQNRAVPILVTP